MREIKFRARSESGEWVYGTPHFNDTFQHYVEICGIYNGLGAVALLETLGQFTGRKDVNGKEIYEGDIVRFEWGEYDEKKPYDIYIGRMEYDESDAQFSVYSPELDFNVSFVGIECEVLGNIHDNPELLQSNQK